MKSSTQKASLSAASAPVELFGISGAPQGFAYAPEIISAAQERCLIPKFESLPFKPFEFHGYLGNRRIVSFGHRYDYAARTLRSAEEMPAFLTPLKEAASRFSGIPVAAFQQALITEYAPGAGIGWHRDKPMFRSVVALSFLAACTLRLRRRVGDAWQRNAVPVEARSAYLLDGPVREDWEHSIAPMNALRYSVTFRTFSSGQW